MPYTEDFHEFIRRQGVGQPTFMHGRFVFENLATSDGLLKHMDPPTDKYEILELEREIYQWTLDTEIENFNNAKKETMSQVSMAKRYVNITGPDQSSVDDLKRGQSRIAKLRKQLEEVETKLGQSPDAVRHRQSVDRVHAEGSRVSQLGSEVMSIEI